MTTQDLESKMVEAKEHMTTIENNNSGWESWNMWSDIHDDCERKIIEMNQESILFNHSD